MAEMLSYSAYMLQRLNIVIPLIIIERIQKMYDYVATYIKPNGKAPLIADNDDGRFLPFVKRDFCIHNYLYDVSSVENRFVSVGLKPMFFSLNYCEDLYEDAGVVIKRIRDNYLFINNSGFSKFPREDDVLIVTHTHNDLLSFELSFNGEDIIVDSGTYLYTSSIADRDCFRSTAKHNTVVVDGEEQNDFGGAFVLKKNVRIGELIKLSDTSYEGDYTTIKGKMYHKRKFCFNGNQLVITDTISKLGNNHIAKLFLHFAVGIEPILNGNSLTIDNNVIVSFTIQPAKLELINDTFSPSYGVLEKNRTAVATFFFNNDTLIETVIRKYGQE